MIILANRFEEQKVIEEERDLWVFNVLVAIGADEDILSESDLEDLKEYLRMLDIEVEKHLGNCNVDIFKDSKLIAQWKQPDLILKKDEDGTYYYEIRTNDWALPLQGNER